VGTFSQHFADGGTMNTYLWARDDVVKDRDLPTGVQKDYS